MDSANSSLVRVLPAVVVVFLLLLRGCASDTNDVDCHLSSPGGCNQIPHAHKYSSAANQGGKQGQLDVYEGLWENNKDVAMETLNTPFMQHMKLGDLESDVYVNFMIQDINYLVKVTEMLKIMSEKPDIPDDLKEFFKDLYESYSEFAELMLTQFNLKVVEIKPIPAMEKYLKDYKTIMDEEEPIFFAVSLLPCSRLWIWLANQLDIGYGNAYFVWKKNNMHGHPEKHYKKLLNDNLTSQDDIKNANDIFRQQMQNERDFFAASPKA